MGLFDKVCFDCPKCNSLTIYLFGFASGMIVLMIGEKYFNGIRSALMGETK